MTDTSVSDTEQPTLASLIDEVFIKPIRSVLIVDDEYPTWDNVISDNADKLKNSWWGERETVQKVLGEFRKTKPARIIDIHNGQNIGDPDGLGYFLHQSDLLVLDYQLGEENDPGERAINIATDLLKNEQFNLIVVHTTDELSEPFSAMLNALLPPCAKFNNGIVRAGKRCIEKIEELDHSFSEKLENSVEGNTHFHFRKECQTKNDLVTALNRNPLFVEFNELCNKAQLTNSQKIPAFFWAISKFENPLKEHQNRVEDYVGLNWSPPHLEGPLWIRTDKGFICFTKKENTNLLAFLSSAIESWQPTPSRLLSAKIRSEISLHGVIAEDSLLMNKNAYWKFYEELKSEFEKDQADSIADDDTKLKTPRVNTLLESQASRHLERLLDVTKPEVVTFGNKIIVADLKGSDGFSSHYGVETSTPTTLEDTIDSFNSYVSTKPISGWHLQPGHIFKFDDNYWVCLSPLCDLVPGQKEKLGMHGADSAKVKPFLAARLYAVEGEAPSSDEINSNTLVYLGNEDDGSVKILSFYYMRDKLQRSPVWRFFTAKNLGQWDKDDRLLKLQFIKGNKDGEIAVVGCEAVIVGQLRYEYALNLIQKFGGDLTRVGLDYVAPPEVKKDDKTKSMPSAKPNKS